MSDYANPDALVSTDWLAEHLNDPAVRIIEVDENTTTYETWFVLHELLGHPNAKNYDGSWTEYGSLVDVPVELGSVAGS
jgi:3-mercaptopyruvate sulfurtransferase SseA